MANPSPSLLVAGPLKKDRVFLRLPQENIRLFLKKKTILGRMVYKTVLTKRVYVFS